MRNFALALTAGLFAVGVAFAAPSGTKAHQNPAAAHKAHLEAALADIKLAELEAKDGKTEAAEKATASAIRQIEEAVGHHKNNPQLHHHHHEHLTKALADLRAAEKQLKEGHPDRAEKDLDKAAAQVKESLEKHKG